MREDATRALNCITQSDVALIAAYAVFPKPDDACLKAIATIRKDLRSLDWKTGSHSKFINCRGDRLVPNLNEVNVQNLHEDGAILAKVEPIVTDAELSLRRCGQICANISASG